MSKYNMDTYGYLIGIRCIDYIPNESYPEKDVYKCSLIGWLRSYGFARDGTIPKFHQSIHENFFPELSVEEFLNTEALTFEENYEKLVKYLSKLSEDDNDEDEWYKYLKVFEKMV